MRHTISKEERRQLAANNAKQPAALTPVDYALWPDFTGSAAKPISVWRSRTHLAQVYAEADGSRRISVIRSTLNKAGGWDSGMDWDELMEIKRQLGMGEMYAVEIYPRDSDVVNVANMRHLWVFPEPLPYGWFAK